MGQGPKDPNNFPASLHLLLNTIKHIIMLHKIAINVWFQTLKNFLCLCILLVQSEIEYYVVLNQISLVYKVSW